MFMKQLLLSGFCLLMNLQLLAIPGPGAARGLLMDSVFTSLLKEGSFNGNVLVAEKGKIIFMKSFGNAEEPDVRMLDANSVFELASCSKQFTAAAIVLLQQKGKLSYDDPLEKWIPALGIYKGVTIRHLLHHTSGLPDYMVLMDSVWDHHRIAVNKDMINALQQYRSPAEFAPGERFEYSNTGYAVLASVIESVSGMSYAAFLDKELFRPLQMSHTFVYTRRLSPRKVPGYAFGYVYADDQKRKVLPDSMPGMDMVYWLDGITGDGTVNSTAGDLLKWDRALYTTKYFSATSLKLMFTPGVLNDGSATNYGLGWMLQTDTMMGHIAAHSGSWHGYTSYIERHTDKDKTIIILENADRGKLPVRVLRDILYDIPLVPLPVYQEIKLSPDQLGIYVGDYELAPGFILTITMDDGQLFAQATGQQKFPLYPKSQTAFFLKTIAATIDFEKNADGEVQRLVLHQGGRDTPAKKTR